MRGAGGGRPPKPEGQRVNRAPSTKATTTLPGSVRRRTAPTPICELNEVGSAVWKALWALPESSQWRKSDVPGLSRLVWLQQNPENWLDARLLAETRQLEDRFGLNPYGRRALGWVDEAPDPATAQGKSVPTGVTTDRKDGALRLLRGDQTAS